VSSSSSSSCIIHYSVLFLEIFFPQRSELSAARRSFLGFPGSGSLWLGFLVDEFSRASNSSYVFCPFSLVAKGFFCLLENNISFFSFAPDCKITMLSREPEAND
jgi:hypothetical protein